MFARQPHRAALPALTLTHANHHRNQQRHGSGHPRPRTGSRDLVARALMSGSDEAWKKLQAYEIRCMAERHQIEPAKVVVGEGEIAVR